jgi:anhydro-N-acetylmuramic acid kinase
VVRIAAERPRDATGRDAIADLFASATAFVAETVAESWRRFVPADPTGRNGLHNIRELLVCGGGVRNKTLMRELAGRLPLPVVDATLRGVDPKAREALVFGLLAVQCILGRAVTAPRATGALAGRVLGKISPAAPAWSAVARSGS